MNGVKNELHVRIEQTARGVWYCSGVDVYAENHVDVGAVTDLVMTVIEGVLDKHNQPKPPVDPSKEWRVVNATDTKSRKVK